MEAQAGRTGRWHTPEAGSDFPLCLWPILGGASLALGVLMGAGLGTRAENGRLRGGVEHREAARLPVCPAHPAHLSQARLPNPAAA